MSASTDPRKPPVRGGGWPVAPHYGAEVAAGSALPGASSLFPGTASFIGQNGYAGTSTLSSGQFAGTGDAGGMVGGGGGGSGDTAT